MLDAVQQSTFVAAVDGQIRSNTCRFGEADYLETAAMRAKINENRRLPNSLFGQLVAHFVALCCEVGRIEFIDRRHDGNLIHNLEIEASINESVCLFGIIR